MTPRILKSPAAATTAAAGSMPRLAHVTLSGATV